MQLLITGGAGFIGTNFIRLMLANYPSHKIINLDKLTYAGNLDNLRDIANNPNYQFIQGDICDKKKIDKLMRETDVVIHFAAESHVDRSIINPHVFVKTNVVGTQVLLESARKNNIKKFIHISTDEVYGSIKEGSFHEQSFLNPNSPYSASKAASDLLAKSYFTTYQLPVIITRSSNNYGPYQYPEKIIPLFITNLLKNKKLPLYGSGENMRDWIYVMDNCEAIEKVLRFGKVGEVYNIGGEVALTNLELTRKILRQMQKDETWIQYTKDRPGHDFRYSLYSEKIKELGWKPKFNFDEGLTKTIDWYKSNTWWWSKLKK